jgi:phosphohistidine swiveling domain-containing protein
MQMLRTFQATDDFEVNWDDPEAAGGRWNLDREHSHGVLTRLELEAASINVEVAHSQEMITVNGRAFAGPPTLPSPPKELRDLHYAELWDDHYRDQAIAPAQAILERDETARTDTEIATTLVEDMRARSQGFRATQTPVFKIFMQIYGFSEFCREHFGNPDGLLLQYRMLQGRETETTEAALGLERLAELVQGNEALLATLEAGKFEAARADAANAAFFAAFDEYVERYGWRATIWSDLSSPTWAEDPSVPIAMIVRYARNPETRPSISVAAAAEDRETVIAEALERLPDDAARDQLRAFLAEHEPYPRVREGRAHWQLVLVGCIRRPLMELANRLVARGLLDDPSDVLHLTTDELVEVEAERLDARPIVASSRADYQRWQALRDVPDFLGSGEPPPNPIDALDQVRPEEHLSADGKLVSGIPASMGVAHGRARVINDLGDAGRLEPGDVLVTRTTAPPWTPLFAVASAIVTEGGGTLSHSAIVAREYKIPAVVGTRIATSAIPDGAMVTVDGNTGTVRIG